MATVNDLVKLKEKVAALQQQKDRAEGALGQILPRIKEDYGCADLKAARTEMEKLRQGADKADKVFADALAKFNEMYAQFLGTKG